MKRVSLSFVFVLLLACFSACAFRAQTIETVSSTLSSRMSSKSPDTEWMRTYGGIEARDLLQTDDGGFVLVGGTDSVVGEGWDYWLVKTDSIGNMEWNRTYGGSGHDFAYCVIQTDDGGYLIAGESYSDFSAGLNDFWLVKTDSAGNMEWNGTYGGTGYEWPFSVIQTDDGGYVVAGTTSSFDDTLYEFDYLLVKTDALGNMEWRRTYGGEQDDWGMSVVQTSDGGYAIGGDSVSRSYVSNFLLVKTDAVGDMLWARTYGGEEDEKAWAMIQTSDGWFAMAGDTHSFGARALDCLLVKTDADGFIEWSETYGGEYHDCTYSMVQTSDGGYALAGRTNPGGIGSDTEDLWLIKTDATGNMLWNKSCGGHHADCAHSIVQTSDGGFAMAGVTHSFDKIGGEFWLVKVKNTIYVWEDGSVDPPDAPISTVDDESYFLTDDINGSIVIARSDITVDGNGFVLQGSENGHGLYLDHTCNVTIKNAKIEDFERGILLYFSSNISISESNITGNAEGIHLTVSTNNTIEQNLLLMNDNCVYLSGSSGNSITGNTVIESNLNGFYLHTSSNNTLYKNCVTGSNGSGLRFKSSSDNVVRENNITHVQYGVCFEKSARNLVTRNRIADNQCGAAIFEGANANTFCYNNFVNNTLQMYTYEWTGNENNFWSRGYPSGNYWSDYSGVDLCRGANQNLTGRDGVGDTAYVLDENNTDSYPLMGPVGSLTVEGEGVAVFPMDYVCLIFPNVVSRGYTTASKGETGPEAPSGYTIAEYYNIQTSAYYSGPITVTVVYDDSSMNQEQEDNLQLMHWDEQSEKWKNFTRSIDIENNVIIYETTQLSTFAVAKLTNCISLLAVDLSKTIVGQGYPLTTSILIVNCGSDMEGINLTVFANANVIHKSIVNLTAGSWKFVALTWNTEGYPKGNYTLTAYADPLPNETAKSDNTLVADFQICVTIAGDFDADFDVDIYDFSIICAAYGTELGDFNYTPNCDLDESDDINIYDVVIACGNYGENS